MMVTARYLARVVGTALAILAFPYLVMLDVSSASHLREIVLNGGSRGLDIHLRGDELKLVTDELGGTSASIVKGHYVPLMWYVLILIVTTVSIWVCVRGVRRFVHHLAKNSAKRRGTAVEEQ